VSAAEKTDDRRRTNRQGAKEVKADDLSLGYLAVRLLAAFRLG
jgi:hypothetical protein